MADIDHIAKDITGKEICLYCKRELNDVQWKSIHEGMNHYKIANCPGCNVEVRIRAGFDGSGHDEWNGKQKQKLKDGIKNIDWFVMENENIKNSK